MIVAVIFDFGGVITSSPFEAFARFEREHGLPEGFIRRVNATDPDDNAWARLERSEISIEEFDRQFDAEARRLGHPLPGLRVLELLAGDVRPRMVEALRICRRELRTACITNNVAFGEGPGMAAASDGARRVAEIMGLFEFVLESSKEGVRKPDPRIYQLALERLGVAPEEAVYLDDLGINLKPARALGIHTIKVTDPDVALAELGALTGLHFPDALEGRATRE